MFMKATVTPVQRLGGETFEGTCPRCGDVLDFESATREDLSGFCHQCSDVVEGILEEDEDVDVTGVLKDQRPLDAEGRVRVNAARCSTCIFNPDSPFRGEDSKEFLERVKDAKERHTFMVCHSTSYQMNGCSGAAAVCAGFWKTIVPLDERRNPGYPIVHVNEHLAALPRVPAPGQAVGRKP